MSNNEIELNHPDVSEQTDDHNEPEQAEASSAEEVTENSSDPSSAEETKQEPKEEIESAASEDAEQGESAGADEQEASFNEEEPAEMLDEQVEQLSLLDGELPHLEAANAPEAKKARAVLEGLLFITGDEGVTAEQAATALDITPELAAEYFDDLMKEYTDDKRGIEIANFAGTYRFLTKAVVFDYAKRLFQISKTAQLSQAALETLAIIAYKQPITRVEIEEIRGVGADMMLRKLMARDLIKESGRSEAAGRPILYEVTDEFMNSFKLLSLKELPELPKFSNDEESEELFNQ